MLKQFLTVLEINLQELFAMLIYHDIVHGSVISEKEEERLVRSGKRSWYFYANVLGHVYFSEMWRYLQYEFSASHAIGPLVFDALKTCGIDMIPLLKKCEYKKGFIGLSIMVHYWFIVLFMEDAERTKLKMLWDIGLLFYP